MTKQVKQKTIAVLCSGGDAPGMNAAIRAVTLASLHFNHRIIGFQHGYNGLIDNDYIELDEAKVRDIIHLGGTILKSGRSKEFLTQAGQAKAAENLNANNIDALIVIGGDGSFSGLINLNKFYQGQLIGIPGTIDNDIDGTENTIGFATAVNTGLEAIDKIRDTADAFERIFLVEVMGRHSGFLALNVGIASAAEQVLTFESFTNPGKELRNISEHIHACRKQRGLSSYIIVVAENLWPGGLDKLASDLKEYANIDSTPCVLGYIQRGGSPVAKDRILATKLSIAAISAINEGKHMVMTAESSGNVLFVDINDAIQHKKQVNGSLLTAQNSILDIAEIVKAHKL